MWVLRVKLLATLENSLDGPDLKTCITSFFHTKNSISSCALDMMSTFLAQQTSQKLFLDFLLGIHKVLP